MLRLCAYILRSTDDVNNLFYLNEKKNNNNKMKWRAWINKQLVTDSIPAFGIPRFSNHKKHDILVMTFCLPWISIDDIESDDRS